MQVKQIYSYSELEKNEFPLLTMPIPAGFPSPADDFVDTKLDLNEYLIKHPAATFFVRVSGNSMIKAGIYSEDILIVDRSLDYHNGSIIIAVLNGELTVKRLKIDKKRIFLISDNNLHKEIEVTEAENFRVWGVVTSVIHKIKQ
ncbi:MAG TPA: translesion error-prone DNA polymerase V autoproteolytic subunit [Candidatus Woesebacteria bacterium]|nr:translesion error-prone DNA polymerase V autoproteolytic subunit [Candidatus Woesebacteria bacterium]